MISTVVEMLLVCRGSCVCVCVCVNLLMSVSSGVKPGCREESINQSINQTIAVGPPCPAGGGPPFRRLTPLHSAD